MIDLIFHFLADVVFFQIGQTILRVVSFGRLKPSLGGRYQPLVSLLGAITSTSFVVTIGLWLNAAPNPQPGRHLFDSRPAFEDYVARMDLASVPMTTAIEKLTLLGFACETFKDGNASCFREARGTTCGERQFIDLLVMGSRGAAHMVSTRFGQVCL